ncbi:tetratricopeptide repeat protein [Candidatus Poribacteria bacterium]|nr:tetratricopeptide repeat protein [Candidatus Poribacteria bacterium]MYH81897.1 tetratricopeptide repeat protein [Candidatus Poribacteria bacterium]MYK95183.1 tetratricopeptide repeat protein [Candidatus Poribacteria bacterium]
MRRKKSKPVKILSDFLEWASQFDEGTYVFRGVPNEEYEIQASAYRRVPENEQNSEDKGFPTFVEINTALIREARLLGYDEKDGRPLGDLEILAGLQHFKAATCLIDFTYSAQVALWFACAQDSKTDDSTNGKVFAVHKDADRFIEIEPDLLKETIPYFLDEKEPQLYHWQPRQQNNRILAQQSIFFFGDYEIEEDAVCIIQKCEKENVRTELERVSGITEIRLFPDFEGFASLRDDQTPYMPLSADEHAKRAEQSFRRHKFEETIADYDKAIYREPTKASLYYSRGLAKARLEHYENAIDDYNDAIRLNPSYASAYYERGLVKARLGQYEPAIADYDKAIGLNPNDALFYNARGFAKEQLRQYEEAREDRQKSAELAS